MKILCAFCKYNYGSPQRGIGTEYTAFLPALRTLGHEVVHFETWDQTLYSDYRELNHALLSAVQTEQPDVLLTVHRDYELWAETLHLIRRLGTVALATWTTDDSFKFFNVSRYIAPCYDAISTTYDYRMDDYRAAGIQGAMLTQWAANSQWLREPKRAKNCKYAVSFVGARFGNRADLVHKLQASGVQVECFGHGWPNGPVPTEEIPRIMRDSEISLNFSSGFSSAGGHDRQIKARTFEVPGSGGFLLTEAAPGLDRFYEIGQEVETFDGLDDLVEKVRFYLDHPEERDRLAQRGYRRTRRCHTYDRRFEDFLCFTMERHANRASSTPSQLAESLPTLELGMLSRAVRFALLSVCRWIWGPVRGVRAARRAAFETSIATAGSRTFTAAGLPGRMFPFV